MKKYIQAALNQVSRSERLKALNDTADIRRKAMSTHAGQYSKEIYAHSIENNRRLRAEQLKQQKEWNKK